MARLLYRLGATSARHRRVVLVIWTVVLLCLGGVAATSAQVSEDEGLPETESGRALDIVDEQFGGPAAGPGSELQVVVVADDVTTGDPASVVRSLVAQAQTLPHVVSVADPLDSAAPYVSEDLTTAVVQIVFDDLSDDEAAAAQHAVDDLAASARTSGLVAEVGGSVSVEPVELVGPTEAVGAAIAFLVLLVTYGSLAAAGATMLVALLGVVVGTAGIFAFSAVVPVGSVTPILAIMLGLAVGIDYGLFMLARFRSELREGRAVDEAISRATGTAGTSVVFAGATVTIALAGLAVVGIPTVTEMGLAAASAVLVAVLMALTLLPGLMSWMGRRALPRAERAPGRAVGLASSSQPGRLERWGRRVVRRPLTALVVAAAVLVLMSVPVLSLQTAVTTPGGVDPASTQRAAYDIVAEKFGAGAQSPLVVLVRPDGADLHDALPRVESVLSGLDGVSVVVPAQTAPDAGAAIITVVPSTGPVDQATEDLVQAIRDTDVDGVRLLVTGTTAFGLDIAALLSSALVTYLMVVVGLGLALVLLVLLFRSLLVPLVATVGFLLSLGAGLGVMVAVFQWGWFDAVVQAPQGDPVPSLLPILVVGILFGLAMDYQVFLVSRMHEAHRAGLAPSDAVVGGFRSSATVVAAAASIMAAVFGGFALGLDPLVGSIALALAVGVLADAFVVRMVVVPALLALLGEKAWWVPAWLDRVLPDLDPEGHALSATEPPVVAPRHVEVGP